jgi:hydroxymethylpyrimidine/phosphomethylpyrimidine kinase
MTTVNAYPVILTIAGSDSGGGAGIQADLKTITALGGFGVSVVTALTAQNGAEVRGIHECPPEFAVLQLGAVLDGFPVRAAKTGMLASAPIIRALAIPLAARTFPLVVDPVCVSQSGHTLLREDAVEALARDILPLADLLTPNRPEASLLAGMPLNTPSDVAEATGRLLDMGAKAILVKGGHFSGADMPSSGMMTDWLALPGKPIMPLAHPRVDTPNNHGTGCALSAAIAAFLGLGHTLEDAVAQAQRYLTQALRTSFTPGIGAGSPNFMGGAGR